MMNFAREWSLRRPGDATFTTIELERYAQTVMSSYQCISISIYCASHTFCLFKMKSSYGSHDHTPHMNEAHCLVALTHHAHVHDVRTVCSKTEVPCSICAARLARVWHCCYPYAVIKRPWVLVCTRGGGWAFLEEGVLHCQSTKL